ncbi:hypothetical protein HDV05_001393 [Chytridiales sp. JEL 0842]|nr:hypothetical protein HDV05_001393 [Chytridiales sp. JEL 0842]
MAELIEALTQKLKIEGATEDLFFERAKAYEKEQQYDLALTDLRNAHSITKSERSAQAIQDLLKKSAEAKTKVLESDTLNNLVAKASTLNFDAEQDEASQRLAASSKDESIARRIVRDGHFHVLLNALIDMSNASAEGDLAKKIPTAVTHTLINVSNLKENALDILAKLDRETVLKLVPLENHHIATLSMSFLASLIYASEIKTVDERIESILLLMVDCLKLGVKDELRIVSINSLIKIAGSEAISLFVLNSAGFELILRMSNDANNTLKHLVPVALARLLENVSDKKQKLVKEKLIQIISVMMSSTKSFDKTTSLLALSYLFQANPSYGSLILNSSGILNDLVDVLEFETAEVQLATLQMLSSATSDGECRKQVAATCTQFLLNVVSGSNSNLQQAASNVLVKLMFNNKELEPQLTKNANILNSFIAGLKNSKTEISVKSDAIEALAYMSIKGEVKARIIEDDALIKSLISVANTDKKALQFGVASIWSNLCAYRKRLSEEEKQILKLRETAGESVPKDDRNDDDDAVAKRTVKLTSMGIVASLNVMAKDSSPALGEVIARVILNLSTDKRNRGRIVQDGGIKTLITLTSKASDPGKLIAAQAAARIAITTDPNIAFKGQRAAELIRPLLALCSGDNQLQQFEGLMALTNLASFDDDVRTRIVQAKGMKVIEYLQFSDNDMVRRAATEALCNMMLEPTVFKSYADAPAAGRLRMLIALCDVDDFETRRAASGALAILSSSPSACRHIVEETRGLDVIMGLIGGEENPEILIRGVECIKNIAAVSQIHAQKLDAAGAVPVLRNLVRCKDQGVVMGCLEALQHMQKAGVDVGGRK